jgi:protein-tyrosine phosphatase
MKLMTVFFIGAVISGCALGGSSVKNSLRFTEPVPTKDIVLVFDKKMDTKIPAHFRKNEDLKMSGSATFSAAGAKYISKVAQVILVIDLRQESHGLINSKPVTWQSEHDWANAGMGLEEVIQREKRYLSEVHIGEKVAGTKVRSVETEDGLVRSLGLSYVRLAVTEYVRPTNSQVDRFIEAIREMPPTSWVHIHDRTGKGRSTTFMIMYDMLRSAWNTSYEEILQRNKKLSDDDVTESAIEGDWQRPYQQDRVAFLQEFYKYAKAHPSGEGLWWSGWAK